MRASLGRMWALALNTFREAARSRILAAIIVVVVAVNLGSVGCGALSILEKDRVARDFSLAGISLVGSIAAIVIGVLLLYTEVQRRTIHSIVTKPIDRWEFVLGKYLGMVLILTLVVVLFALAMTGQLAAQHVGLTTALVKAMVLAWMEVLVVAAIALFFSSFSTPFLAGVYAFNLFLLGRLAPDIEHAAETADSPLIRTVARGALEIIPDLHLFSVSGRTLDGHAVSIHGDFVTWTYVATSAAQGLCWIAGLLVFAALIFRRRDFV
jgi:ABC-type transport system involved in multi-copper enzyme maturation permease subunit